MTVNILLDAILGQKIKIGIWQNESLLIMFYADGGKHLSDSILNSEVDKVYIVGSKEIRVILKSEFSG